ncbi:Hypothetical_protein [Hexamita inflata]|uniref:Hypothetical_protein n=1 Tax=Hexamita inflata TaxID=28002 RepID=A0AA86REV0_9EUKA|nr:Hypothetical protein HINF_LOCUS64774 [Hexamita inflata]CAI9977134.1 Hypothetical protein HINF_LOCUS64779 [Hexamita inflata]
MSAFTTRNLSNSIVNLPYQIKTQVKRESVDYNIIVEVDIQASELRRKLKDVHPKEFQEQLYCNLEDVMNICVEDRSKSPISKINSYIVLIVLQTQTHQPTPMRDTPIQNLKPVRSLEH